LAGRYASSDGIDGVADQLSIGIDTAHHTGKPRGGGSCNDRRNRRGLHWLEQVIAGMRLRTQRAVCQNGLRRYLALPLEMILPTPKRRRCLAWR
jgi:hypothetical protein